MKINGIALRRIPLTSISPALQQTTSDVDTYIDPEHATGLDAVGGSSGALPPKPSDPGRNFKVADSEQMDALGIFLSEVRSIPPLNAKKEIELGRQIAVGKDRILELIASTPLFLSWLEDVNEQMDGGRLTITTIVTSSKENGFIKTEKDNDGTNEILFEKYLKGIRKLHGHYHKLKTSNPDRAAKILERLLGTVHEMNLSQFATDNLAGYVEEITAKLDVAENAVASLYARYKKSLSNFHSREPHVSLDDFRGVMKARGTRRKVAHSHANSLGIGADTLEEFIWIFRRSRDDALSAIGKTGMTTKELTVLRAELQRAGKSIERAKKTLVEAHLGYAIHIALASQDRGLELDDLIQEGNIGLLKAADHYDYRRGYRFNTYARWWIKKKIQLAIKTKGKTIRVPINWSADYKKLISTIRRLHMRHDRKPTLKEISRAQGWSPEKVERTLDMVRQPLSLFQPVGIDGNRELIYFVKDTTADNSLDLLTQLELKRKVEEALAILSPRRARVLRMRYGLSDGNERKLKEIAQAEGIARQAVQQHEKNGLMLLRNSSRVRHLKEYFTSSFEG